MEDEKGEDEGVEWGKDGDGGVEGEDSGEDDKDGCDDGDDRKVDECRSRLEGSGSGNF